MRQIGLELGPRRRRNSLEETCVLYQSRGVNLGGSKLLPKWLESTFFQKILRSIKKFFKNDIKSPHKVRKWEKIAQCEFFWRKSKPRTKCEMHKVKPHKVRATCNIFYIKCKVQFIILTFQNAKYLQKGV